MIQSDDTNKVDTFKVTDVFLREYERLVCIKDIFNFALKECKDKYRNNYKGKQYECQNIIERWLLSMVNQKKDKTDAILTKNIVLLSATSKMRSEFVDKRIPNPDKIIAYIVERVNNFYVERNEISSIKCNDNDLLSVMLLDDGNVTSNKFVRYHYGTLFDYDIPTDRHDILVKILAQTQPILTSSDIIMIVATLLVRYSCLLQRGQQWSLPLKFYTKLVILYELSMEGFSSPLNSQLLVLFNNSVKFSICTLFKDTDEKFGSVGSIFNQDVSNKRIMINPPYIIDIMDRLATFLLDACDRASKSNTECLFVVNVAAWKDAPYHIKMSSSKYLSFKRDFAADKHYYENLINNEKITAKFETTMFILSCNISNLSPPPEDLFL